MSPGSSDPWAEELPVKIAGPSPSSRLEVLDRVKARRLDRSSQFAMVAAMEAWADSGLVLQGADLDPERVAVAMASGIGGVTTLLSNYDIYKVNSGPRRVSPLAIPMLMPNGPAATIGLYVGAQGRRSTPRSRRAPRATRRSPSAST